MYPGLSFDQAPPISVPYRFFLTAPWFGVAAGLFLAVRGPDALTTRWAPDTLVVTHLLTVGFMLQAMLGALLQVLPVAAGSNVWRPRLVGAFVHPLLTLAAVLLAFAFVFGRSELFVSAASLFAIAVGAYLAAVGWATVRTPAKGQTIVTIRFALLALAVTVTLGVILALGLGGKIALSIIAVTNVHAAWGLGGWALLLLAGVGYFVIPMFQLTPPYPAWLQRGLAPTLMAVLAVWSLQLSGHTPGWQSVVFLVGVVLAAVYGVVTLRLQQRRRRKVTDATFKFFRIAMGSLITVLLSAVVWIAIPVLDLDPRMPLLLGVLTIAGVFVSAITGMLYKIVPFLNWLHLQRLGGMPPNMSEMIRPKAVRGQMRLHLAAIVVLVVAIWVPLLARPAGVLFAASCAWLGWNLVSGVRMYVKFDRKLRAENAGI